MNSCIIHYEVKTDRTEETAELLTIATGDIWRPSLKERRTEGGTRQRMQAM